MTRDQLRASQPALAAWADDIRKELEGSKVSYLHVGEFEYGEKSEKGVTPTLDYLVVGSNKRTT